MTLDLIFCSVDIYRCYFIDHEGNSFRIPTEDIISFDAALRFGDRVRLKLVELMTWEVINIDWVHKSSYNVSNWERDGF